MFVELFGVVECSVLSWSPAGDVPVTCSRGGVFSQPWGVVRTRLATGTVLESTAGMFFANTVRYICLDFLKWCEKKLN